jgi:hypothetical protein
MAGGMDILIIGIADDNNLDDVASDEKLEDLFVKPPNWDDENDENNDRYIDELLEGQERLANDPNAEAPLISYIRGEIGLGWATGAALGYLVKKRQPYAKPEQISPVLLNRINELTSRFRSEMQELGLDIGEREVGLVMVNIRDT